MLAVDLLHEFELGVWKVVFTHLVQLLIIRPYQVSLIYYARLDTI